MYDDQAGELQTPPSDESLNKLHWRLLPLFCLVAALCYLDRSNLAYASIPLARDLGFTPETYGLGSSVFFAGYALAMIPSSAVLVYAGAPRWLGLLVTVWGLVATGFCLVRTASQFYIMRLLLGVAEAGTFPGMWFALYLFYPVDRLTVPLAILEASICIANALAGPLAALLLLLDGVAGLHGWQWLFLLEGLPAVLLGCSLHMLLPKHVQSAEYTSSSHHQRRLMAHHSSTSGRRFHHSLDGSSGGAGSGGGAASGGEGMAASWQLLMQAAGNDKLWYLAGCGLLKNIAATGMLFWCPVLVGAMVEGETLQVMSDMVPTVIQAAQAAAGITQGNGTASAAQAATARALFASNSTLVDASVLLASSTGSLAAEVPGAAANSYGHLAAWHSQQTTHTSSPAALMMTTLPFAAAAAFSLWHGRRSQKRGERAVHLAVPYFIAGLMSASFPRLAARSTLLAFLALTAVIVSVHGTNSILHAFVPAVSPPGSSVAISLALYHAVASLGGILGPLLVGEVVQRTGSYGDGIKLLGVAMCVAAIMAWSTRHWPRGTGPYNASGGAVNDVYMIGEMDSYLESTEADL